MNTIARLFPRWHRRKAKAQARLASAYTQLFSGHGSVDDANIVLVDLAREGKYFYAATPGETSDGALWDMNGSRRIYGRILQFTQLPPEALEELAAAVMLEDAASQEEGTDL